MGSLQHAKALIIVNNWGIEETEMTRPLDDLRKAGATVTLAAPNADEIATVEHDRHESASYAPDAILDDVDSADYDMLIVPGGTCNVDRLRINPKAISLAQEFAKAKKPIAAICHGPWLLVNAGLTSGKTLTSCRYIAADVENSGGVYRDQELLIDDSQDWRLITSRNPGDLDAFVDAIESTLSD
ncbi:MAG: type 1 glutamine amidotransferase domain-containing protein [Bifidobacterium sp.]|uniref:Type 1 glutamine amidotransferase domain-containing protein n=1 Tax=Bifidobacterium fermentum TaxID=3059035 RepID=A0AB39UDA4_9BIFI